MTSVESVDKKTRAKLWTKRSRRMLDCLWLSLAEISDSQENCMPLSPNHRGRSVVYLASICVITILFALAPPTATALPAGNTITVNSTLDVADGADGLCTLREAITAANTDTASGPTAGECGAGSNSDSDTISLTGLTGTITLASALPNITADVSINGPGASQLTISGNNSFRVFSLTVSSPGAVNFSALTIANGRISNDVGG